VSKPFLRHSETSLPPFTHLAWSLPQATPFEGALLHILALRLLPSSVKSLAISPSLIHAPKLPSTLILSRPYTSFKCLACEEIATSLSLPFSLTHALSSLSSPQSSLQHLHLHALPSAYQPSALCRRRHSQDVGSLCNATKSEGRSSLGWRPKEQSSDW
jgi:hypothetical protein